MPEVNPEVPMLRKTTINARMIILICTIVLFTLGFALTSLNGVSKVKEMGVERSAAAMLEGENRKLQVATHSMAVAVGAAMPTCRTTTPRWR